MSYNSELYQQVILDHNRKPRNFHIMENAKHSCDGHNPLCGDEMTVYLEIAPDGVIRDISFTGSGCAISKASASLMTTSIKGKSSIDARAMFDDFQKMVKGEVEGEEVARLGKLVILEGVREYSSRIKCATLAWHTMICALDEKSEASTE